MAQGPEVSMKKNKLKGTGREVGHGLRHLIDWDERKWGQGGCERSYNLKRQWEGKEN